MQMIRKYQVEKTEKVCPDCLFIGETEDNVRDHVLDSHPEIIKSMETRLKLFQQRTKEHLIRNPQTVPRGNRGWVILIELAAINGVIFLSPFPGSSNNKFDTIYVSPCLGHK